MNFYQFFSTFVGHFCPPGSGSGFRIRIRIRIHIPDWIRIQYGSGSGSGSGSTTLWLIYNDIMQSTDSLIVHFFFFFFFAQQLTFSLLVKIRQINVPNWPAKISCREKLPDSSARIIRRIICQKNLPFQLAACLPEIPPSLLKIPRQDPARHPSPPPAAPPTEQGGGGREPARPTHASWTGTFTFIPFFMNGYISLYDTIHTYSIQSGLIWKYNYIAVGERIIC